MPAPEPAGAVPGEECLYRAGGVTYVLRARRTSPGGSARACEGHDGHPPPSIRDASDPGQAKTDDFASLASARYLLLSMFKPDGALVSSPVQAVVDGDTACIRTWRPSGTWRRLQQAGWVQVTPCTLLGLCRYGPTVDATVRPLHGEQASRAAGKLARKYPLRRGFLSAIFYRLRRCPAVYYELLPDVAV